MSGRFWLVDVPDVVVPGQLTLGPEGPHLQLDGSLTAAAKPDQAAAADDDTFTSFVATTWADETALTIHGDLVYGGGSEPVTVVDALTVGRDFSWRAWEVGPGHGQQRLEGLYALRGGHVAGRNELFTGVRVRLRHLDEWADLGGFQRSVGPDQASITFERPLVPPAPLLNGGYLHLDQDLSWNRSGDSEQLTRSVWLRADHLPVARWSELDRSVVTPLTTLLTLAADMDCPALQVEVSTGANSGWLSLHASGLPPLVERPRPARDMLLPLKVLGLARVAMWLDRVEALGPLPPVVAAAAGGHLRPVEVALLELTTVAEGLARRLWPDWARLTPEEADVARRSAAAAVAEQGEQVSAAV